MSPATRRLALIGLESGNTDKIGKLINQGHSHKSFKLTQDALTLAVSKAARNVKQSFKNAFERAKAKYLGLLGKKAPRGGVRQSLRALYDDYWSFSKGVSIDDAKDLAKAEGFGFEIGRTSRFENARDAVIIGRSKLKDQFVNKIELAEEIQHGLARTTSEAGRFMRRNAKSGLSAERLNDLFHVEHFHRIIKNWENGKFQFLSAEDIASIRKIIEELQ